MAAISHYVLSTYLCPENIAVILDVGQVLFAGWGGEVYGIPVLKISL